ncbi:MAG: extracellular solute-binding protein [Nitrososphaerales archaeon]
MGTGIYFATFSLVVLLFSSVLFASVSGASPDGRGDSKSAAEKRGEEYVKVSAAQRHEEHIALGATVTEPYRSNLNYSMFAQGSALRLSNNASSAAEVFLGLSIWKSTNSLVTMDIMSGTLKLGDDEKQIHSGHAYYLAYARQVRVVAFIVGDTEAAKSLQILTLKAKVQDGILPALDSDEKLEIQVLSPQSKLASEWIIELDGEIKLAGALGQQKTPVVLTAILDNLGDEERFHTIIGAALERLTERHPDLDIQVVEIQLAYPNERTQFIAAMTNGTSIDLFSADQIWLGELADRGFLTDLTNHTNSWGRASEWYQSNWDGGGYKGATYGIWVWTDVRGMYYSKALFNEAGVDPDSLRTWNGYISAAGQLNEKLGPRGIQGVHLTGVGHSPDLWYPYLWMLGGEIVEQRGGHPTKGEYWFPVYNSTQGVQALTFIKDQLEAGIVPQRSHFWGKEFANGTFAVMIEASHVPAYFQPEQGEDLEEKIGYIPALPVPDESVQTATLMGGWELTIPITSKNKDLTWELISLMVEPDILAPWLAKYNYLPTQLPIGEGPYAEQLRETNPFFDEMASLIQYGHGRPSIPEYPQIADHIREAIEDVYSGKKEPKQALDDAAAKSAESLGWVE